MYHIPYMILTSQISDYDRAKLIIEGVEVYFERQNLQGLWLIKARIYYPLDCLTDDLKETLESLDHINVHGGGALKAYPEKGFVVFSKEYLAPLNESMFKSNIVEFMSKYDFWKSVVDDMIKSEGLLLI